MQQARRLYQERAHPRGRWGEPPHLTAVQRRYLYRYLSWRIGERPEPPFVPDGISEFTRVELEKLAEAILDGRGTEGYPR